MTREEAEKILHNVWPKYAASSQMQVAENKPLSLGGPASYQPMTPGVFVQLAVSIGMLKLDEPKSAEDRFWALIEIYVSKQNLPSLRAEWPEHRLKIIEK